jgi:hypothetical protein
LHLIIYPFMIHTPSHQTRFPCPLTCSTTITTIHTLIGGVYHVIPIPVHNRIQPLFLNALVVIVKVFIV